MNEEFYEYKNTAKVPGEIQNVKNPIMFELTARQLAFVGMTVISVVFTWLITCRLFEMGQTAVILLCFLFGVPFLTFGFIRPMDMNLESWLALWWSNNIKSAPVKKLSAKNAYELAIEKQERSKKDKKPKKRKTKPPKGTQMNQKILDGKINVYFPDTKLFCYQGSFFRIYKIGCISPPKDINLINNLDIGYKFQYLYYHGASYLLIGLENGSDRFFDFIAENMNITMLTPWSSLEAVGIEELSDQFCAFGFYDLSISKPHKNMPYMTFSISDSKQLKLRTDLISNNESNASTMLITGLHNPDCERIIDKISSISEGIITSIHFKLYDPVTLKNAVENDSSIKPLYRKTTMLEFLDKCILQNDIVFNECMFVRMSGTKEEIHRSIIKLISICTDECLNICSLHNQQRQGFNATLPLLNNRIAFYRVISGLQMARLMPVSEYINE